MTNKQPVKNEELLYRRIKDNQDHIERHSSDKWGNLKEINPDCFFDSSFEPSVFRAKLTNFNPCLCRVAITDSVVGFTAGEVHSIHIEGYKIKVFAKPDDTSTCCSSNEYVIKNAHAIIEIIRVDENPPITKKKAFYEVLGLLADKAKLRGWILPPHSP